MAVKTAVLPPTIKHCTLLDSKADSRKVEADMYQQGLKEAGEKTKVVPGHTWEKV